MFTNTLKTKYFIRFVRKDYFNPNRGTSQDFEDCFDTLEELEKFLETYLNKWADSLMAYGLYTVTFMDNDKIKINPIFRIVVLW